MNTLGRGKLKSIAILLGAACLLLGPISASALADEATTMPSVAIEASAAPSVDAAAPAAATEQAATEPAAEASAHSSADIVWTLVAAFLVFFMQAGFAMVETGFTRAKNAVNIMMKNTMDFCIGTPAFFLIGFGLMFGTKNGFCGTDHFWGNLASGNFSDMVNDWNWTFMIFQTVFAATAATIVSGAMAERTKFPAYLIYSFLVSLLIYPIFGSWAWGGLFNGDKGWLEKLSTPFCDFAGSTVVHSIGGWLALAGAICLGPRLGKYVNGKPKAIPGHSITLAALGVFILWFGWFGFNPGSTNVAGGYGGYIAVTTNLAAAMGAITAMFTAWIIFKKPDASMTLNGVLAGLVAITAGCASVSPIGALCIGGIAGVLVVLSVIFVDRVLRVDDPVGAVSVHAVNGVWGTLACGLFNVNGGLFYGGGFAQLGSQALGVLVAFGWAFGLGMVMFTLIKKTVGLRAGKAEELRGLDIGEHGMEAYSGFQIFVTE